MKISVITVVRNAKATIEEAVRSVLRQDYSRVEYIVVDGASNDGTVDVLQRYRGALDVLVSERDEGLYHAINKGIALATGDFVGLLHADDWLPRSDVISTIAEEATRVNADAVYGDLLYISPKQPDQVLRRWRSTDFKRSRLRWGWMPPHPTLYLRRELFDEFGGYDPAFGSAADYELILRFLYRHRVEAFYIPKLLYVMRAGGTSNASLGARLKANSQDYRALIKNGVEHAQYARVMKPARKLGQYVPH